MFVFRTQSCLVSSLCNSGIVILNSTLGCVTFFQTSRYQGILKATVSGVFEDLKFKISEGLDQN